LGECVFGTAVEQERRHDDPFNTKSLKRTDFLKGIRTNSTVAASCDFNVFWIATMLDG
jgi:hypothetical protein